MKEPLTHIPYEKITENLDAYAFDEKDYRLIRKQKWVVTEKVHGAHLCIHTNGKVVTYAKRKEILSAGDDFFNYQELKKELEPRILSIFSRVRKDFPAVHQLSVHGELFGGEYPHPDVLPVKGVQAIQTGVYYCPDIRFYAFDMAMITNENVKTYIDYQLFAGLSGQVSLFYSQALFIGSFHDAMAYKIEFETTIPALLGLPSLGSGNKAEGVVIKPEKPFFIDSPKGKIRPIIKRKIPEFSEDKRFNQAQKWNKWKQKEDKGEKKNSTKNKDRIVINDAFIKDEIDPLITSQRFASAVSKTGRMCKKNRPKILRALIDDVLEALIITFTESYPKLGEDERKKLYTVIKEKCKELIAGK